MVIYWPVACRSNAKVVDIVHDGFHKGLTRPIEYDSYSMGLVGEGRSLKVLLIYCNIRTNTIRF